MATAGYYRSGATAGCDVVCKLDTLFRVHNQSMGDNLTIRGYLQAPGLIASVLCMQEEFRAKWLDSYR